MPIVFQSRSMLQVLEQAKRYARSSVAVFLHGESGTGKELVARLIHDQSPRQSQPYLRLNCAALSETLIESELFGHEAGAFTGAGARRIGYCESTRSGTLFLDEIGELPGPLQAKLLRVLEEREFHRVGGNEIQKFEGRFVSATNRDLEQAMQDHEFREDLFHRLNVLALNLPPLRDRKEDIPPLVQHFIRLAQPELDHTVKGVTRPVMQKLCDYDWPGNVRELKNVILRSCILSASETIDHVELPTPPRIVCFQAGPETADPELSFDNLSLEEIERRVILHRLRCYRGNKTETAAALGVTPRTLRNKVSHYRKLGYVS
ncbi:sigma-54 interaction domain-containing protein [Planctomicrobium sp. SH661]|uniref:sigma-54 interaction domain-containing protein n=1 Tax=Planctomicrobium sp. SH661 TaxID=3448124 RepID=UPI003F5C20AB